MENKLVKYGIFWEPPSEIEIFINEWKSAVRPLEPNATYLSHPVHCTLFLIMCDVADEHHIISKLKDVVTLINEILIPFRGWHVFENDAATGGDTLVLEMTPSEPLFDLQLNISEALIDFKRGDLAYPTVWQGVLGESYKKWGFPFVGSHWIPHLSVASVVGSGKSVIKSALAINEFPASVWFDKIGIYRIDGDIHTKIHTIELKKI